jgi:hypothetical protein
MKTTIYYHKNSDVIGFKKVETDDYSFEYTYDKKGNKSTYKTSNGYSEEYTYDKNDNELTYKNSDGEYRIKGKYVTEEEYENFVNAKPLLEKKVIIENHEYTLK